MESSKTNIPKSKTKNAIGYARVSTDTQYKFGTSVEKQRENIQIYAEQKGFSLIDILEESKSASSIKEDRCTDLRTDRPELQKILDKARKHEFTELIIASRDRLSRDFFESLIIKSLFVKSGINIHYVNTSETLSSDYEYMEKFIDLVFSNIAMLEAGMIGQRAKSGLIINIENGYYAGGPVPYGYTAVSANYKKKKRFKINTSQSDIIQRIFALYNLRFSYAEIIKILKDEFPSETEFYKSTISQIINNEVYTGHMIWNRKSKHQLGENDTTVRSVDDEKMKIISAELFNKAITIKDMKAGMNILAYKSNFILKGKLYCGSCGKAFKAKNNGKGKKSVYYCTCNNEKTKNNKTKWSIKLTQNSLEKLVLNLIHSKFEELLLDNTSLEKYYDLYCSNIENDKRRALRYIAGINTEIKELQETIENANSINSNMLSFKKEDANLYGDTFFDALNNAVSLTKVRKNQLEQQVARANEIVKLEAMSFNKFVLRIKSTLSRLIEIDSMKPEKNDSELNLIRLKRMLIDDIIDKIVVNSDEYGEYLSFYLKIPQVFSVHNFQFLKTGPINELLSI